MFRVEDDRLIGVLDRANARANAADFNEFSQELTEFFKRYIPEKKPCLEGLLEILTQRKEDGTLEFDPDVRIKAFKAFNHQLEIELCKLSEVVSYELHMEAIPLSRMLSRQSKSFYGLVSQPLLEVIRPVDDGQDELAVTG